jgi:hypothetical protein
MQWVYIDYIVFSFPAGKNTAMDNIIMICDLHVSQSKANIDMGNEINHM